MNFSSHPSSATGLPREGARYLTRLLPVQQRPPVSVHGDNCERLSQYVKTELKDLKLPIMYKKWFPTCGDDSKEIRFAWPRERLWAIHNVERRIQEKFGELNIRIWHSYTRSAFSSHHWPPPYYIGGKMMTVNHYFFKIGLGSLTCMVLKCEITQATSERKQFYIEIWKTFMLFQTWALSRSVVRTPPVLVDTNKRMEGI